MLGHNIVEHNKLRVINISNKTLVPLSMCLPVSVFLSVSVCLCVCLHGHVCISPFLPNLSIWDL